MIIFDLDGTLCKIDHRLKFVRPEKDIDATFEWDTIDSYGCPLPGTETDGVWFHGHDPFKKWKPNWPAFYDACDQDVPNMPVIMVFNAVVATYGHRNVQIWSGRSDVVWEKTHQWLKQHISAYKQCNIVLKMRGANDNQPDVQLKQYWLDGAIADGVNIAMAFDDRSRIVDMWRRNGITCAQVAPGDF